MCQAAQRARQIAQAEARACTLTLKVSLPGKLKSPCCLATTPATRAKQPDLAHLYAAASPTRGYCWRARPGMQARPTHSGTSARTLTLKVSLPGKLKSPCCLATTPATRAKLHLSVLRMCSDFSYVPLVLIASRSLSSASSSSSSTGPLLCACNTGRSNNQKCWGQALDN